MLKLGSNTSLRGKSTYKNLNVSFSERQPDEYTTAMCQTALAIGTQKNLSAFYDVYKTALATKELSSERGRAIIADAFIENQRLGPLTELCVRVMAAIYLPNQLGPIITDYPGRLRIYYDNLSVDLALESCYQINNDNYWRRVVYAKSLDRTIAYKKLDWKSVGLTLKYVEMVESCPAEFWPDEQMKALAQKIYKYVTDMHLKHLKSLEESSFRDQIEAELAGESSESSSVSSSDEDDDETQEEEEEDEDEDEDEEKKEVKDEEKERVEAKMHTKSVDVVVADAEGVGGGDGEEGSSFHSRKKITLQDSRENLARLKAEKRASRKQKRALRAAKKQRHEARQLARRRASLRGTLQYSLSELRPKKSKQAKKPEPEGVFDIEIEPPEPDDEDLKIDRRNMHRLIEKHKRFPYLADLCHHIDLRFIRYFPLLTSFTIEFLGPRMERNFHTRHFNFSTKDIEHLASGLLGLKNLKVFRLCNSRMNAQKLLILTSSLKKLPEIETLDFKNDQLDDECGPALFELFQSTTSIKSLELEGNRIGADTLQYIGNALSEYEGTLEYLGLGRNQLEDDALHFLNEGIIGTQHIRRMCLAGVSITQEALWCCVANELMRQHPPLTHLDMSAVPVSPRTALELVKALQVNFTLVTFDIRACNFSNELIVEVEVLVKRNNYMANNPFVEKTLTTESEVLAYHSRLKHPVLMRALASAQKRSDCWFHHTGARRYSNVFDRLHEVDHEKQPPTLPQVLRESEVASDAKGMDEAERESLHSGTNDVDQVSSSESLGGPFFYDANTIRMEEFNKYVRIPGPKNRYHYFRDKLR